MGQYLTHSEEETKQIADKLAKQLSNDVIALTGELGTGKTTFVQGFAKGLEIKEKIISPTFVLIKQHQVPKTNKVLYHIDLYRLENEKEFKSLGLEEIITNPNNLVLIEWAEKITNLLPKNTTWIKIKKTKDARLITVS